ncbi:signal recognition particle, SRP19 subunit [Gloeophyllum trabeum ATCC 11539]|uniref:Signal recognition particle, SRP19 subunit n=1 Tax=Gloeophyllum trabeum (strain ATCC 11539 / FP-39264 / Madison 617) TaxID=670483 RepID=S7RH91_GLOTA|nr:signal recognition particle, SRP19 subunit [Gloeophyllum trabeum ATCC 11539]EPQ53625.1 signal recognition particle, SRP19 subunit [Gloeophyllum trabeum ATCC 11539]
MSRRTAILEEFDDETDLPLPSRPLPNTGARGAILEEIEYDLDDEREPVPPKAGPASPSQQQQFRPPPGEKNVVTDITPYKSWTCVYPIYIDAKRAYGRGERRVPRAKAVWWPLSKDIADASTRLGLQALHEVQKAHPRDWDNPGRVRIQWKKDGRLLNPRIKTKKQLLEALALHIQQVKPDNVPREPYNYSPQPAPAPTPAAPSSKGKQPLAKPRAPLTPKRTGHAQLPLPPQPEPELASRVSPYSPSLPTGMLLETVKAGMNAQEPALPGAPPGAASQKGKRKVVRVRG